MTVRWTVRAATDRRAQFARRIKSRHPHQVNNDRVERLGFCLPERSDGRSSALASDLALKTVINCFLNERHPHQIRTQNRIQLFVPILRFLLLFRGIFALSRHKKHIFDKRSSSSERFCTFGGWAFLFALNLWVIVKIMVIVKIIVCGRYLVLKMCLFYAII